MLDLSYENRYLVIIWKSYIAILMLVYPCCMKNEGVVIRGPGVTISRLKNNEMSQRKVICVYFVIRNFRFKVPDQASDNNDFPLVILWLVDVIG